MARRSAGTAARELVLISRCSPTSGRVRRTHTESRAELLRGEPVGNRRPTSRAGHSDRRSRTAASNGAGDQRGSAQAETHTRAAIGGSA